MSPASHLAKDLTLRGSTTTIPKLLYGTAWKKDKTTDLVYKALKNGLRGLDTAAQPEHYNEKGVGEGLKQAVREGLVSREDIFIQTKFTADQGDEAPYDTQAPTAEQVHQSVKSSLGHFAIEGQEPYLDSVVLHHPLTTIEETVIAWKTLETYVPKSIRNLGISNTALEGLQKLEGLVTLKPSVVQNRFVRKKGYERELRAYCREKGIVFQSFWTLKANTRLLESQLVADVALKAGVSSVAAYYSLVLGLENIAVLDGTSSEDHMRDNVEGVVTVGNWAAGDGSVDWASALAQFKELIREP